MSWKNYLAVLAAVGSIGIARGADKAFDEEGFIRLWLVAGPIPLPAGVEPGDAIDKEQIPGEAKLDPKVGDRAGKELVWKPAVAGDYFVDLNETLGESERSVAYLVAKVTSPDERTVTLKVGSDDQCKVYLNGTEVLKSSDERPVDKDQNTAANLTLKKGPNVVVLKVVNLAGEWKACARFFEPEKPLTGLKIEAAK